MPNTIERIQADDTATPERHGVAPRSHSGWFQFSPRLAMVAIALGFFTWAASMGTDDTAPPAAYVWTPTETEAIRTAQDAVRSQLIAPSSASFVNEPSVVKPPDGQWIVIGQVDAQNAFGTPIRYKYIVRARPGNEGFVVLNSEVK